MANYHWDRTVGQLSRAMFRTWTVLCVLVCSAGWAGTPATSPASPIDTSAADYSAIECLQKASRVLGKPVDLIQLLTSQHLPPHGDASMEDLAAIAQEQALYADPQKDLTPAQLRHAAFPVLLHVKGSRYSGKPDHYIVCTGIQNGQAQIFNPPATEINVSMDALAMRWQGEALLLSTNATKTNLAIWRYQSYAFTVALAALAVFSVAGIRFRHRFTHQPPSSPTNPTFVRSMFHVLALIIIASAVGFGTRLVLGESLTVQAMLPSSPDGPDPMDFLLQTTSAATEPEKAPDIGLEAALGLHAANALFVDAREPGEFAAGHIKGALSCPASDVARLRLNMAGIPLDRKIAVYCISSHCGKGRYLATTLMQQGYTHVALYNDGWSKWTGPKEP